MPRTEDIERFTEVLNSLGDEPAIRAARSETIEQVAAPGAEASTQESDELDSLGIGSEGAEAGSPGEAESLQDIFQSLSALPEEGAEESGEPEAVGPAPSPGQGPGAAGEGLDFASLFGEEPAPEGIEDLEPGNLQADLDQMETLPDDLGLAAEPETPTPAASSADAEAFEDLGAFSADAPAPEEFAQPEPGISGGLHVGRVRDAAAGRIGRNGELRASRAGRCQLLGTSRRLFTRSRRSGI